MISKINRLKVNKNIKKTPQNNVVKRKFNFTVGGSKYDDPISSLNNSKKQKITIEIHSDNDVLIDEKDIILERSDDDLLTHSVSTEPLLSLSKKRVSNISGSTFYFVLQCELNVTYTYKIQKASCERIKKNSNVIAVQTLQFQKKKDI